MKELVIDVGNSNVVLAKFNNGQLIQKARFISKTLDHGVALTEALLDEHWPVEIEGSDVGQAIYSSVVPSIDAAFFRFLETKWKLKPIHLDSTVYQKLDLDVVSPEEIGSDLVANAYAGLHLYQTSCIIVDFGTALTITGVDFAERRITGVTIAPGLRSAVQALFLQAEKLPHVPLEFPGKVQGQNTIHAIQSGILWGYNGMVRFMLDAFQQEMPQKATKIATGGFSHILDHLSSAFDVINPNLTLEGLRLIGKIINNTG